MEFLFFKLRITCVDCLSTQYVCVRLSVNLRMFYSCFHHILSEYLSFFFMPFFFFHLTRHAGIAANVIHCVGISLESALYVPQSILVATINPSHLAPATPNGQELDKRKSSVKVRGFGYGTGEERIHVIRQKLDQLTATLRRLDLSLRINSVTGIDPVFRFCEVGCLS